MTENRTDFFEAKTAPDSRTQRPPAPKHRWSLWLIVALVVVVGIIIWQRRGTTPQAKTTGDPAARAVVVSTATARQGSIGINIDALGTVTPVYTVTVTSRVQGEIMNVNYREGQMVHKGDSLLEIDPRPYQAAVTQMEGQLAHDQALLNEAKIDLDRYQTAFSQNAIAKQQVDDQEQAVLQDEGTVKNDQGQLENAKVNLAYTPYHFAD